MRPPGPPATIPALPPSLGSYKDNLRLQSQLEAYDAELSELRPLVPLLRREAADRQVGETGAWCLVAGGWCLVPCASCLVPCVLCRVPCAWWRAWTCVVCVLCVGSLTSRHVNPSLCTLPPPGTPAWKEPQILASRHTNAPRLTPRLLPPRAWPYSSCPVPPACPPLVPRLLLPPAFCPPPSAPPHACPMPRLLPMPMPLPLALPWPCRQARLEKLQGSSQTTVTGLLEELKTAEGALSAERRRGQLEAEGLRMQVGGPYLTGPI